MANTIAKAIGYDSARVKETHRLGSVAASAEAATWRTFAHVYVRASGSGYVTVIRDGVTIHRFEFGKEKE